MMQSSAKARRPEQGDTSHICSPSTWEAQAVGLSRETLFQNKPTSKQRKTIHQA